jgi:hypothetical protein
MNCFLHFQQDLQQNIRLIHKAGYWTTKNFFFKIGIVGGGIQLGQFSTAATNRPIVPTLGDYDDGEIGGMMIVRGNQSTQRKPAPMPLCPPQTPRSARMQTWAVAVGSQ